MYGFRSICNQIDTFSKCRFWIITFLPLNIFSPNFQEISSRMRNVDFRGFSASKMIWAGCQQGFWLPTVPNPDQTIKKHARAKIVSLLGLICILSVKKQRESVFCYVKSNLQQISYIPVKFLCEKSNWARRTSAAHSAQKVSIWLQIDHRAKNPYMVADNRKLLRELRNLLSHTKITLKSYAKQNLRTQSTQSISIKKSR